MPGPGMAVYYAGKAYVLSFSEALGEELKPRGITVTALCPGPAETEFQARAGMGEACRAFCPDSPSSVAKPATADLMAGKRRVVPGVWQQVLARHWRALFRAA